MLKSALAYVAFSTQHHQDKKVARADAGGALCTQPDYGQLSPLAWWVMGHVVHILDFTCRMLESSCGADFEYALINSGLPSLHAEATIEPIQQKLADLLSEALVKAWNTHRVVQMQTEAGALTNELWKRHRT